MKTFKIFMMLAVIGVLSVQSRCKKDQDPGPCFGATPFKADFTLGEIIGDSLVATDTLTFYRMTARAAEKYASIKWEIGSDPRGFDNQQEVGLNFGDATIGQTFTVRMIAKGTPNTACYPNDDGIDTVTKQFTRVCAVGSGNWSCMKQPGPKYTPPVYGIWRGSMSDNPNREFDITFVAFGEYPPPGANAGFGSRLFNLPEGCGGPWVTGNLNGCGGGPALPTSAGRSIGTGALAFYSDNSSGSRCCPFNSKMFGRVLGKDRNQIVIYLTDMDKKTTIFNGKRVQ